ncbi:MAG TPA: sigma 54-interacting transcriptional regulator [Kofleriaceae bacterium]
MSLGLIASVLYGIAGAHTARALVRSLAVALDAHVPIRRVEIRVAEPVAVEKQGGEWRTAEPTRARGAVLIGERVAVVATRLPKDLVAPEFRAAFDQVIETAVRHLDVVQRLAEVSRRAHLESRDLRADLQRRDTHSEVIARSGPMRDALSRAQLVAPHSTTVLLTGESGSGKEVMAREIHRLSPRANRPMLQLNCGAIPETLVESELFGHERGAFTGADRQHKGVFERADRGTLFLDEVGELPLAAQVKLLRVLQERKVRRVGGTEQIDVDVRLVAATNRHLASMVADGQFREDLLYRLDVFSVRVPALRERRGDIAPLVSSLLAQLSERLRIDAPPVTRTVLSRLEAYDWPGNVRELANVLEAALILGDGVALQLPAELVPRAGPTDEAGFDAAIRATIEKALRETRGKIYGTGGSAERLGLKPATLQSKMKKLGIRRGDFR